MFSTPLVLLSLCASVLATVYVRSLQQFFYRDYFQFLTVVQTTSPIASTTFTGGQQAIISWQEDGKKPSLADFGPAKVSIYVGNAQQQTSLQTIVASVDVSTTGSIQFTPDSKIGPNSDE